MLPFGDALISSVELLPDLSRFIKIHLDAHLRRVIPESLRPASVQESKIRRLTDLPLLLRDLIFPHAIDLRSSNRMKVFPLLEHLCH